jgi:hypothetical protein
MPACGPLLPKLTEEIQRLSDAAGLRRTVAKRVTLLTAALLQAQSVLLRKLGEAAIQLDLTDAHEPADVERTLSAILQDERITLAHFYHPLLRRVVDWEALRRQGAVVRLILDESSLRERIHLVRIALAYRGTALTVACRVWQQQTKLPAGEYWTQIEAVLAEARAFLPADLPVLVLADRAFDVPAFLDRVTALGWDYLVRVKQNSALKYQHDEDLEAFFRDFVAGWLPGPGHPWSGTLRLFKKAGWRTVGVAMTWVAGHTEPLVVCSSRPASLDLLTEYRYRFWVEPSFKTDKSAGWQWEASQIRSPARHERLLVAMALATLFTLVLGAADAECQLAQRAPTGRAYKTPPHAGASLFTLGLRLLRRAFSDPTRPLPALRLPALLGLSWNEQWREHCTARLAA